MTEGGDTGTIIPRQNYPPSNLYATRPALYMSRRGPVMINLCMSGTVDRSAPACEATRVFAHPQCSVVVRMEDGRQ